MVPTGLGAFLSNVLFSVEPRTPSTQIWLLQTIYRGRGVNYQLKRIWNEVRSSVKRAGKNVEARRSIWRRIAEEARRAASQEPRSATSLRQPFPGRMPDKPARRTHKGRIQENRSGRGKR